MDAPVRNGKVEPAAAVEQSLYEIRKKIYPRAVSGKFAAWRWIVVLATQLVFYGTPWLTWNDRQAVLFDLASRKFYIFGLVFWQVKRVNATNFSHKTRKVEDTSIVALGLANGARIHIEVSWSVTLDEDHYFYHVFGTDGSASLNPLHIYKDVQGHVANLAPAKLDPPQHLFKRTYETQLKHFLGAVRDHHPVVSTADEAVQRMRIVDAVYKSARLKREVVVP